MEEAAGAAAAGTTGVAFCACKRRTPSALGRRSTGALGRVGGAGLFDILLSTEVARLRVFGCAPGSKS